jgi:hypothetical protein
VGKWLLSVANWIGGTWPPPPSLNYGYRPVYAILKRRTLTLGLSARINPNISTV